MYTLTGIALNLGLSAIFVIVLSSLFLNFKRESSKAETQKFNYTLERISQSLLLCLLLVSLIGYNLPKFGINPRKPLEILGYLLVMTTLYSFRKINYLKLNEASLPDSKTVITTLITTLINSLLLIFTKHQIVSFSFFPQQLT